LPLSLTDIDALPVCLRARLLIEDGEDDTRLRRRGYADDIAARRHYVYVLILLRAIDIIDAMLMPMLRRFDAAERRDMLSAPLPLMMRHDELILALCCRY